jgi:hypothetical protein
MVNVGLCKARPPSPRLRRDKSAFAEASAFVKTMADGTADRWRLFFEMLLWDCGRHILPVKGHGRSSRQEAPKAHNDRTFCATIRQNHTFPKRIGRGIRGRGITSKCCLLPIPHSSASYSSANHSVAFPLAHVFAARNRLVGSKTRRMRGFHAANALPSRPPPRSPQKAK